jgi:hypothetical protein
MVRARRIIGDRQVANRTKKQRSITALKRLSSK